MRKLIELLYNKYCKKEYSPFELIKKELSPDELEHLYFSCKTIVEQGVLQLVVDMVIAESQDRQLDTSSCSPVMTTEAEKERMKRNGIGDLMEKIQKLALKAKKENEDEFDRFSAI